MDFNLCIQFMRDNENILTKIYIALSLGSVLRSTSVLCTRWGRTWRTWSGRTGGRSAGSTAWSCTARTAPTTRRCRCPWGGPAARPVCPSPRWPRTPGSPRSRPGGSGCSRWHRLLARSPCHGTLCSSCSSCGRGFGGVSRWRTACRSFVTGRADHAGALVARTRSRVSARASLKTGARRRLHERCSSSYTKWTEEAQEEKPWKIICALYREVRMMSFS